MHTRITRTALLALCITAAAAVTAASAQAAAAVTATTMPATAVTPTSAALNATIDPDGLAVSYVFEYWPSSTPNAIVYTPAVSIGSGIKTATPILAEISGLKPDATYSFELLASTGTAGSTYYPLASVSGGVLTLKTDSAGKISLTSTKLKVKKNRVSLTLNCASALTCDGKLSITAKGKIGTKTKTVACGKASFTIAAGDKEKVVTSKISGNCITLLNSAPANTIKAKLTAKPSTLQPEIRKPVRIAS